MWGGERTQFAWSAAAACLVGFCLTAPASAQSDAVQKKVSKSGKANQEVPLTGFSRLDNNCAGTGPPRINLDARTPAIPARTGFVSPPTFQRTKLLSILI
jgi:hypothetical protein